MPSFRNLSASTRLEYLKRVPLYENEKPYQVYTHVPGISEDEKTNLVFESRDDIIIHDARGREGEFDMEKQGFEFLKRPTRADLHKQTEDEMNIYLKEIEELFLSTYKADRVFIYDFRVRYYCSSYLNSSEINKTDISDGSVATKTCRTVEKSTLTTSSCTCDLSTRFTSVATPFGRTRDELTCIDHTMDGGRKRIRGHMKEETDELLGPGWIAQIVKLAHSTLINIIR